MSAGKPNGVVTEGTVDWLNKDFGKPLAALGVEARGVNDKVTFQPVLPSESLDAKISLLQDAVLTTVGFAVGGEAGGQAGTEVVQRAMSRDELKATQATGLVRGGRSGTHYASDAVNSDALRARQRLALPQTPEVKVTMEVPKGTFTPPSQVQPSYNMPGGGMERTATGNVPATIKRFDEY